MTYSGFNDRGGSWSTFLRFSENTADDHLSNFKQMQRTLRQKSDAEAIRRNLQRKQQLLKSPTLSSKPRVVDNIVKDRSRKAIKRAQFMHAKINIEKQLAEVNSRLGDTNKPPTADEQSRLLTVSRDLTNTLQQITERAKDVHRAIPHNTATRNEAASAGATSSAPGNTALRTIPKERTREEELLRQERRKAKAKKRKRQILLEQYQKLGITNQDGIELNFLDAKRLSKKKKKEKHKKKKHAKGEESSKKTKERFTTKIAKGPSIFAKRTVPPTPCPCRMEALVTCKQCGAFCHSECINADYVCTLCVQG